ncbi:integrase arm-type DNA-binding domain-containing protein [Methylobacterium sp. J-048]|uniref:integrase arm-type DNA-binding domain-containing protein n=1 Tax=Methylobacterium sp. J-048 TaxID=2836635 RepID=UPI001FB9F347|nr:integrase arm-type DNA-binding domain-containing protein [Methylobacterium sp. J-048]MCJ2057315.1 integrase arm-type DNA-binding domain-containing protein [Methylobacterium sp. J-048]
MGETTSRGTYARERVRMTAATLTRAASMIRSGALEGRGAEILDTDTPGLTLRVTRAAGTWYLRHRKGTIRLGSMDVLNLPAAREAAARARRDVELGVDPRHDVGIFERQMAKGADLAHAVDVAFPISEPFPSAADRRLRGPWQWQDLQAEFLAAKLPGLRESYRSKYAAYHQGPEFEPIANRELQHLDIANLESLRDRVAESRTVSAAARVVAQNKEALTWAWRYHGTRSGLSDQRYPWWQEQWAIQYSSTARDHTPTVEELVRTLLVAEHHRCLGGNDQQTEPGTLAALWAVVLTGQRTGALGRTRRAGIIGLDGRPAWQVWTWTGQEMKGGRRASKPHALPIPPAAVEAIARCGADPASPFVFPSRIDGKHVTPSGYTQFFYRIEGKEKDGKAGSKVSRPLGDLFQRYGIRRWTPHDARRTLGTYLDDEGLGGAASAILAHSKDKGQDDEKARIEDITRRVYAKAQRLPLKAAGMEPWVQHVLAAYEREAARFRVLA